MIDVDNTISPLFLKTFRKAYETLNFTETASQLNMTQSGVSQHIAQIEKTIQTKLFERVGKKVIATKIADQLYTFGGQWLLQMEETISEIQNGEKDISGSLSLGCPGSFGVLIVEDLINWQRNNPKLFINIEYGPNSVMERELRIGKMDLAITNEVLNPQIFTSEQFFEQEYVLISHKDFGFKHKNWEDFCNLPIIDYVGSEFIFQNWLSIHYPNYSNMPTQPNFKIKINNMDGIFNLVEKKVGYTIFPAEPISNLSNYKNIKIHKTKHKVINKLYLCKRRNLSLNKKIQEAYKLILSTSEKN